MKNFYKKYKKNILKINHKNKGFMLVEVILAFAIFAIVMGGIYGIVLSAMKNNKAGEVKQKAALYGQQIFEDIKSGPIKIKDNVYKVGTLSFLDISHGKKLKFKGEIDFGNEYKGYLNIERNTSIIMDKDLNEESINSEISNDYRIYNFKFDIKSERYKVILENISNYKNIILNSGIEDLIQFKIKTITRDNEKIVEVFGEKNNLKLSKKLIKDGVIKLNLNFDGYKTYENNHKYKDVKIYVSNKDKKSLYISINKPEELNVKLVCEEGTIKPFINTISENLNQIKLGELYDVTVEVKNKEKTEFFRQASQNIDFN
ncbi:type IV pilus modification PilV family protein [Clostridium taeniosporum]|uniref:Uncharacterized protein n=1 Tax=Clostridium taeniosporum TaxID=394958 RepID=A0A1D7XMT4_9CLOT|nr:prepilin-type N-terminal cleavage/methylation domain-containing protein [Clostridium taeniosporum]AOR24624.1 hypothetical protein BGI42_13130 [Clostridium taeniosporum]